jgi:hypothetical protein
MDPSQTKVGVFLPDEEAFYCLSCGNQRLDASSETGVPPYIAYRVVRQVEVYPHPQHCHRCGLLVVCGESGFFDRFLKYAPAHEGLGRSPEGGLMSSALDDLLSEVEELLSETGETGSCVPTCPGLSPTDNPTLRHLPYESPTLPDLGVVEQLAATMNTL